MSNFKGTLNDVCLQITDGKHGDCTNKEDSGYYFVSVKDIDEGEINYQNARQITKEDFEDTDKRTNLELEDILITNSGTIGKMVFVTSPLSRKTTFQKSVAIIKPNKELVVPKFLYYYLVAEKRRLVEFAAGTTQKNLLLRDLRGFEVNIPPKNKQLNFIKILDYLDQKIKNNRKINQNLESIIKFTYRNWFEEFEPFKNEEFYNSKLGEIPVGWEVKPLEEFIKFQEGPGIRNWQYVEEDGVNFLNIRCIQNNDLLLDTANMISKEEAEGKYSHFMLDEWDIVISSSGTLGRYAIVRKEHLPLCLNTSIIRFAPIHSFNHYSYVYAYLTSRGFYHYLLTMGSGSVQLNFGPTHLKQIDLIIPPEEVIGKYNDLIFPLIQKMKSLKSEIDSLTKLRDTLLPKLMSGEIDVSNIVMDS